MKLQFIVAFSFLMLSGSAVAQPASPPPRYDLDVQGLPLREALEELSRLTQLPLLYRPELLEGKESQCVIKEASAEALLTCVLKGTGLTMRRLSSGTYVLEPAPEDVTLSGFIENAATGNPLPGATVYAPDAALGTTSNRYGFYSLTLPSGKQPLIFSYVGYRTQRDTLNLTSDMSRRVKLRPRTLLLDSLTIEGDRAPAAQIMQRSGVTRLTPRAIQQMPALMGATDALKTAQMLPGVTFGVEGTNSLYVRGGSADQNKILLDGIPLHHSSHLLGILSSFNPDVLDGMTLFKGAFPAKYGGRLSSVIDVDLREGNRYEYESEGAIGLLSSRLLVEGPIRKGKSSFLLAGRRSYADLFAQLIIPKSFHLAAYFYDVNAKFNTTLSPSNRLYLNLYTSRDRLRAGVSESYENVDTELTWANLAGSIRWNHLFNDRLFSNTTLTYSRYGFYGSLAIDEANSKPYEYYYRTNINDLRFRSDFEFFPSPSHTFSFGIEAHAKEYQPGRAKLQKDDQKTAFDSLMAANQFHTLRGAVYAEDGWQATDRLRLSLGLRAEAYGIASAPRISLQPRLSARYNLRQDLSIKAGYAAAQQYQHRLISSSLLLLPTDIWAPATDVIPPASAHVASMELAYTPQKGGYTMEIGAYYKKMSGLAAYDGVVPFTNIGRDFERYVTEGEGRSYGMEFLLRRRAGATTGWLAYTLSWSTRRFDGLNNGEPFPFRFDRRHALNLVLMHRLSDSFSLSAAWTYATGQAITIPSGHYWGQQIGNHIASLTYISSRNNFRLPPYHRLDLSAIWDIGRNHTLAFGIYNVYNRINPVVIDRSRPYKVENGQVVSEGPLVNEGIGILPILPYVQYRFTLF